MPQLLIHRQKWNEYRENELNQIELYDGKRKTARLKVNDYWCYTQQFPHIFAVITLPRPVAQKYKILVLLEQYGYWFLLMPART